MNIYDETLSLKINPISYTIYLLFYPYYIDKVEFWKRKIRNTIYLRKKNIQETVLSFYNIFSVFPLLYPDS